jgi:hypothetical protein
VKKESTVMPLFICILPVVGFGQATKLERPSTQPNSNTGPYVQLNPSGPQTITAGPLNIIAPPDNPALQCTLCLRDETTPTHNGGAEFEMFSKSPTPGNFATHYVANYWAPPDGASVGNFYPVYFATEANGNSTWATYVGAAFDSGNGGGASPVYGNWDGVKITLVNNTQGGGGVTVPGYVNGLHVAMPGILGGFGTAGVRVDGLTQATNLAFYAPSGRFQTDNGDIIASNGKVLGTTIQVNGTATWTAAAGEPAPNSCLSFGSLYSRTDAPDSSHALYVCTPQGWVAK